MNTFETKLTEEFFRAGPAPIMPSREVLYTLAKEADKKIAELEAEIEEFENCIP